MDFLTPARTMRASKLFNNTVSHPIAGTRIAIAGVTGYIGGPQAVMQKYPPTDQSLPARYARAIAMFRRGVAEELWNCIRVH